MQVAHQLPVLPPLFSVCIRRLLLPLGRRAVPPSPCQNGEWRGRKEGWRGFGSYALGLWHMSKHGDS